VTWVSCSLSPTIRRSRATVRTLRANTTKPSMPMNRCLAATCGSNRPPLRVSSRRQCLTSLNSVGSQTAWSGSRRKKWLGRMTGRLRLRLVRVVVDLKYRNGYDCRDYDQLHARVYEYESFLRGCKGRLIFDCK
jgi:hypothetical protein